MIFRRISVVAGLSTAISLALVSPAVALTNGTDPPDTAADQAIVRVLSPGNNRAGTACTAQPDGSFQCSAVNACTGTLVTPTLVLTAGHCFEHGRRFSQNPPAAFRGTGDWERPDTFYNANILPGPANQRQVVVAEDGVVDDANDFQTAWIAYAVPGDADMALLQLQQAVPANSATPIQVGGMPRAVSQIQRLLARQRFGLAGFGGTRNLQTALTDRSSSFPCRGQTAHKVCVRVTAGARLVAGDSGGPLLRQDRPAPTTFGVLQAAGNATGVHTALFYRGGSNTNRRELPNIAEWLTRMTGASQPSTEPLSRGRRVRVYVEHLEAKSDDACGQMDFYGKLRFTRGASGTRRFGVVSNRDRVDLGASRQLEATTAPGVRFVEVEIEVRDDDDAVCGGGDDVVDIVPRRSVRDLRFRIDLRDENVIPLDSVSPILGPTGFWWTDGRDGSEEAQITFRVAVEPPR